LYPAEDLESYGDAIDLSIDDDGSISESFNKRIRKEWKSPTNFIQKHDSMRDNKSNFDSSPKYLKERKRSDIELLLCDGIVDVSPPDNELIEERDERIWYSEVHCNKDFIYIERINGRDTNLLEGLELHSGVFNSTEQNGIVDYIYRLQRRGQQGRLRGICKTSYFLFILQFSHDSFDLFVNFNIYFFVFHWFIFVLIFVAPS
jgi:mRNA N6-methyladenine demethylase